MNLFVLFCGNHFVYIAVYGRFSGLASCVEQLLVVLHHNGLDLKQIRSNYRVEVGVSPMVFCFFLRGFSVFPLVLSG